MNKFCVFGNPIAHSLSPIIHQEFAKQAQINIEYTKINTENFNQSVEEFIKNNGKGANVTVPFKELAFEFADNLSKEAKATKAVNTLYFKNGKTFGHNTDGLGLIYDLTEIIGINLQNKSVLIIGAGGATRGILLTILEKNAKCSIVNRTKSKAKNLVEELSLDVNVFDLDNIKGSFDIIINATSISLTGDSLNLNCNILKSNTICYDLMYGKKYTNFMFWAKKNNCKKVFDGLGMLVSQAAFSFALWNDFMPDILPVLQSLKCKNT